MKQQKAVIKIPQTSSTETLENEPQSMCGSLNEFDLLNTQIAGLFTGSSPSVIELESHRHTTDNNRHNRKMNFTFFFLFSLPPPCHIHTYSV